MDQSAAILQPQNTNSPSRRITKKIMGSYCIYGKREDNNNNNHYIAIH